nr:hypothetical protein [Tanacetum cinerariifolium]
MCERCGIDMLNEICPLCHLSNSCAYDYNQNSFDCSPDSYHPPHPTYETYSGDTCGNVSHFGYDCPPQFLLNYEPEPGYIQNYNSYPHDSPSFPQQYPCGEDCGSLSDEDVSEKIYSNPLFDEEIIPMEIDHHSLNAEFDLIESMPNHDSSIIISSKIDYLFYEFIGELTLLKSFPPRIDETDCHPEKEFRLVKRLLYDNSSPRPPEEIVSDISNADIES